MKRKEEEAEGAEEAESQGVDGEEGEREGYQNEEQEEKKRRTKWVYIDIYHEFFQSLQLLKNRSKLL